MDQRVAKRYALALYRAAASGNVVSAVEADLLAIQEQLRSNPTFHSFLYSPRVPREEKLSVLDKLFQDKITSLTHRALRLLLQKRREHEFEGVLEEFVNLRREGGLVLYAKVTSSSELTPDQKDRFLAKLREKSGKVVEADFEVDPSLIGGAKVAFGNFVLDGSLKGSLDRLRDHFTYDLLKQN